MIAGRPGGITATTALRCRSRRHSLYVEQMTAKRLYRDPGPIGLASGLGDRNDLRDCAERVVSGQGGRGGPPPTRMTGMIVRHLGLHLRRVGGCGYRRRKR
ncbi:MAG: hypothetical protein ACPH5G_04030 [Pseudooceanicola atlanticus]